MVIFMSQSGVRARLRMVLNSFNNFWKLARFVCVFGLTSTKYHLENLASAEVNPDSKSKNRSISKTIESCGGGVFLNCNVALPANWEWFGKF